MTKPYKRDSEYVAEHMHNTLQEKGIRDLVTVKELEAILRDALANAHPDAPKYGGYVLYVP